MRDYQIIQSQQLSASINNVECLFLDTKLFMSIKLIEKTSRSVSVIKVSSAFVEVSILRRLAAPKFSCEASNLTFFNAESLVELSNQEVIKEGDNVIYCSKGRKTVPQKRIAGVVYQEELEDMIANSKVILIRSANEENIERAKQCSMWATTYSNQQRLKYFFSNFPKTLLLFTANRSYEIKGIARMASIPSSVPDKSIWHGVSNIRLGGNFRIEWLRKDPLNLSVVEKALGSNFKEMLLKYGDGQQLSSMECKRLSHLFPVPHEAYYSTEQLQKETEKQRMELQNHSLKTHFGKINNLCLQNMMKPPELFSSLQKPNPQASEPRSPQQSHSDLSFESQKREKRDNKRSKKIKKRRHKNRKYSRSSSSSDDSDSNSYRSSSSSSSFQRKHRKIKKQKKHRKKNRKSSKRK